MLLDRQHRVIVANQAMADLLGLPAAALTGRPCHELVHELGTPDTLCPHSLVLNDGLPHVAEIFIARLDRYYQVTASPIYDPRQNLVGSLHYARDISEQHHLRQELAASEARYRVLAQALQGANDALEERVRQRTDELAENDLRLRLALRAANAATWEWYLDGRPDVWSEGLWALYGLEPHSCIPSYYAWFQQVHPEDRAEVAAQFDHALANVEPLRQEYRIVGGSGEVRWVTCRALPSVDAQGGLVSFTGIVLDVTERRQAEESLRLSEQKFATLFRDASLPLALLRLPEQSVVDVNEAWSGLVGFDRQALLGGHALQQIGLLHDAEVRADTFRVLLSDKAVSNLEENLVTAAGQQLTVLANLKLLTVEGELHVLVSLQDVTHLKQQELELLRTEERYRLATCVAKEAIWEVDFDGGSTRWNSAYVELFGDPLMEDNHLDWLFSRVHPEDRTRVTASFEQALIEGRESWSCHYRMLGADGGYLHISDRAIIVRDSYGTLSRVLGAKQDVSDQVRSQLVIDRLSRSQQRRLAELQLVLDTSPIGLAITYDLEGRVIKGNRALEEMVGVARGGEISKRGLHPQPYRVLLGGEDLPLDELPMQRALRGHKMVKQPLELERADGSVLQLVVSASPLIDADGSRRGAVGAFMDITELAHAWRQAAAAELKLESALDSIMDAVFIADTEGRLLQFNVAFAVFHRFADKAQCPTLRADYQQIMAFSFPNGEPAPFEAWPIARALRGERGTNAEYGLRRKDTGESWVGSYSFAPLCDQEGRIVGAVAAARDVTEQKRVEEQLLAHQKRLREMSFELQLAEERERCRIAGELHDQVAPNLLLVRMKIDALAGRLPSGEGATCEEIDGLLARSVADIRSLTFQLRPPVLATGGLEAALRWLVEEFREKYGLKVSLDDDKKGKPLSFEMRSTLFQVVRELLYNTVKHAQAGATTVTLRRQQTAISVTVSDDGVGFDADTVLASTQVPRGFGLFSVAEKIRYFGGTFAAVSAPGCGTCVTITLPLAEPAPAKEQP
jgi:PAS domain S-box-containing protein